MPDLTYTPLGLFTAFYPETKAGEDAWRAIAAQTEGTGNVLTVHLADTLAQLAAAGYSTALAPIPTEPDEELLELLYPLHDPDTLEAYP